jgi:hypothetical protein
MLIIHQSNLKNIAEPKGGRIIMQRYYPHFPRLVIQKNEIDWALERFEKVLTGN